MALSLASDGDATLLAELWHCQALVGRFDFQLLNRLAAWLWLSITYILLYYCTLCAYYAVVISIVLLYYSSI